MALSPLQPNGAAAGPQPRRELAKIPPSFVDQVNDAADIARLVGRSVPLKKTGTNLVGLCPFHTERSPSFTVAPHKGLFKCFGCGAAGRALDWLMEHDGIPFREAVKMLADDAGMLMPPSTVDDAGGSFSPASDTTSILAALDLSGKLYSQALRQSPQVIEYLKSRRLTGETVKRFGIGYSPNEWRGLELAFPDYATNPFLLEAGLVREKEKDDGHRSRYDAFRNRVMFPVRDTRGRIIAWGARALPGDDAGAKYINSTETPVFLKSNALFGLYEARMAIRAKKCAMVVEGYMDVVGLSQAGFENAVAGMGTAFTKQQLERLLAMTDTVIFAFDGDEAGRKAAMRALRTALPLAEDQCTIKFLLLPDNLDPDEMIRDHGAEGFQAALDKALTLSEFLISELRLQHNNLATAEDRARFASEAANLAKQLPARGQLAKIINQLIAQEAAIPGSALKAIARADSRSRPTTLWTRLIDAAQVAPSIAVAEREDIIPLLSETHSEECALIAALAAAPAGSTTPEQPTSRWLIARDTLSGAIDLIVEHREQQAIEELKAKHRRGEIDDGAFARQMLAIRQ